MGRSSLRQNMDSSVRGPHPTGGDKGRHALVLAVGVDDTRQLLPRAIGRAGQEPLHLAAETGAEILAVACPYCMAMFEDSVKTSYEIDMEVKDVAELLADSLED